MSESAYFRWVVPADERTTADDDEQDQDKDAAE